MTAVMMMAATDRQRDAREPIPVAVTAVVRRIVWISVVRPIVAPTVIPVLIGASMTVPHDHSFVSVMRGNHLVSAVPISATLASIGFWNNDRQQREGC